MDVDTEETVDAKVVEVRRDEIVEQEENRVLETQADNKIQVKLLILLSPVAKEYTPAYSQKCCGSMLPP